jgi:hypothetical protein
MSLKYFKLISFYLNRLNRLNKQLFCKVPKNAKYQFTDREFTYAKLHLVKEGFERISKSYGFSNFTYENPAPLLRLSAVRSVCLI